jgi:hypothetical protein
MFVDRGTSYQQRRITERKQVQGRTWKAPSNEDGMTEEGAMGDTRDLSFPFSETLLLLSLSRGYSSYAQEKIKVETYSSRSTISYDSRWYDFLKQVHHSEALLRIENAQIRQRKVKV